MIDLTPLDIRRKKGDFSRGLRGYDCQEVDQFLDLVAERLEEVVKVNLTLRERVDGLAERVQGQEGRERAVQEALVTAQSLKQELEDQARREAELIRREAEGGADRVRDEIKRTFQARSQELVELSRARSRFLKGFRSLLERELDGLEVAEAKLPSDELDVDIFEFGRASVVPGPEEAGSEETPADTVTEAGSDEPPTDTAAEGELDGEPTNGAEPRAVVVDDGAETDENEEGAEAPAAEQQEVAPG